MDLNRVTLLGNISNDPDHTVLKNKATVTHVHVATNYIWKEPTHHEVKEKVDFHSVVAWGKLGQIMHKFLTKGDKVYIEGRLSNRSVEGKDGKMKYYTDIVADRLIMLNNKKKMQSAEVESEVKVEELTAVETV